MWLRRFSIYHSGGCGRYAGAVDSQKKKKKKLNRGAPNLDHFPEGVSILD